ncbi:hypothetical protein [Cupriavidus metallidurans]|uniref:hypothetical protein n=1 Tax=Cupriavidus metallidurans TaxID=119219 RepID=UPI001647D0B2|nr:hypothetical protein [Cupriavidus metallidurans]
MHPSIYRDVLAMESAVLNIWSQMMSREGGLHETAPRIDSAPLRRAVTQFISPVPDYPVVCAELLARLAAVCRVLDEGWAGYASRPLLVALADEITKAVSLRPEA